MNITTSALSLNVPNVAASAAFAEHHLGFKEEMNHGVVISMRREDVGYNLIFLQSGLESFKPSSHAGQAGQGTLIVFVVNAIDQEYERLKAAGVHIVTPIETEPWGERYFQMVDPNGLLYQLVQWVTPPSAALTSSES